MKGPANIVAGYSTDVIPVVAVHADMDDLLLQESIADCDVRFGVSTSEKSNSAAQDLLCCNPPTGRQTLHNSAAHNAGGSLLSCSSSLRQDGLS